MRYIILKKCILLNDFRIEFYIHIIWDHDSLIYSLPFTDVSKVVSEYSILTVYYHLWLKMGFDYFVFDLHLKSYDYVQNY